MAAKNNTEVIIDGKVYTLSGYESQEYLQKVATYINDKIAEFKMLDEYKRIPSDMRSTLLALNIADDYFKAKNQVEKLEQDLEVKDRMLCQAYAWCNSFPCMCDCVWGWFLYACKGRKYAR